MYNPSYTMLWDMSGEDFQAGPDRFPPTRRSVIEAVRSIDAEERAFIPSSGILEAANVHSEAQRHPA